jgi:hypothetical protein
MPVIERRTANDQKSHEKALASVASEYVATVTRKSLFRPRRSVR